MRQFAMSCQKLRVSQQASLALLVALAVWFQHSAAIGQAQGLPTATAVLSIKPQNGADAAIFKRTQCDLMKTRTVLETALKMPHVAVLKVAKQPNAADWLEKQLKVKIQDGTDLVEVSMSGEKTAEITILVNAVVDTYLKEVVGTDRLRREARLREYEKIHIENIEDVQKMIRQLHAMKMLHPEGYELRRQASLEAYVDTQIRIFDINRKLTRLKFDRDFEQVISDQKRLTMAKDEVPNCLVDDEVNNDPQLKKLTEQRNRLKSTIDSYASFVNTRSPAYAQVQASLKNYQEDYERITKLINARRRELETEIHAHFRAAASKYVLNEEANDLRQREAKIKVLTGELQFLRIQNDDQWRDVERLLGRPFTDIAVITRRIEDQQDFSLRFTREIEALKKELQSPPRIRLVQSATEPQE